MQVFVQLVQMGCVDGVAEYIDLVVESLLVACPNEVGQQCCSSASIAELTLELQHGYSSTVCQPPWLTDWHAKDQWQFLFRPPLIEASGSKLCALFHVT